MTKPFPGRPPRLARVYLDHEPLYFVTFGTWDRISVLASDAVHAAFVQHATSIAARGIAVGRYVIMPDHVHLFVRMAEGNSLGQTITYIKQRMGRALPEVDCVWQPGFFDHLLRNNESYAAKWDYVYQNPVRADLVCDAEQWPYAGEIVTIDRT